MNKAEAATVVGMQKCGLAINVGTAKLLGITFSTSLLVRTDELIE
jgi:hypothetical protein